MSHDGILFSRNERTIDTCNNLKKNLKNMMLNARSQSQKVTYSVVPFIQHLEKTKHGQSKDQWLTGGWARGEGRSEGNTKGRHMGIFLSWSKWSIA